MGSFLKKPVKDILFVTIGYTLGGSENMIALIAPTLKMRGYKIRVLAFKGWGTISEKLKASGIECIALHGKSRLDLRILWRYFLYLRKTQPDLVIAFLYRAYIPSRIFSFLLGIPNISSVRNVGEWMNLMQKFLDRITAPLSYVIYSCSNAVTEFLVREVGIKKKNIVTIPNGIDLKSFSVKLDKKKKIRELGLKSNFKVVGTVSRLHEPTKGIKILLEAFKIAQSKVDSQLLIVGSGKDEKILREKAKDMGIKALFLGERSDISELLQVMDVFVLPSLSEGFPVVILEAMATGIPIVASRAGGLKEVILDGKTGFLVDPGNPNELAENIKCLLVNEKLSKKFGKAGLNRVKENFPIEKTVDRIESLWKGDLK